MASDRGGPTLHDYIALWAVKASKRQKDDYSGDQRQAFYDEHFEERHVEAYKRDVRSVLRRREIQRVTSMLPEQAAILDVACGVGDVVSSLAPRHHVYAMDFSFHSLGLVGLMAPGIPRVNSSLYALPFRDESMDAVICLEVLEHLPDDRPAVAEITRILKPGGRAIVSVPSQYYFDDYFHLMGHFRHYTRHELVSLLESAGLRVERYLNHYPHGHNWYLYVYWSLVSLNAVRARLTGDRRSIYEWKLGWMSAPPYTYLSQCLLRIIAKADGSLPLERLDTSTFCVARKTGGVSDAGSNGR